MRRYFLNIACCGVSALAASYIPRLRWLGATLAYVLAGAAALLAHRRLPALLRLDGGEWRQVAGLALAAGGQGRYFAGGMQICPGADPASGALRVSATGGVLTVLAMCALPHRPPTSSCLQREVPKVADSPHALSGAQAVSVGGREPLPRC